MSSYRLVKTASTIPVPGGKLIEELFGRVNTGTETFSLAHMVAPPGWAEPAQTPEFGELTLMIRGTMNIQVADDKVTLTAGQALWVEPGVKVRYRNASAQECEYYAVCIPAFHPDRAHREAE